MTPPPSRLEARSRLGHQTANELGAPVASSIPGQLPGQNPHQQGRDTKMVDHCYGGIDVSKDRLDVLCCRRGDAFRWITTAPAGPVGRPAARPVAVAAIGIEPSGGYERGDHPCPAGRGPVGATHQPQQTSPVRPCPRRPGQERSPRCAVDRGVCRDHADTGRAPGSCRRAARRGRHHAAAAVAMSMSRSRTRPPTSRMPCCGASINVAWRGSRPTSFCSTNVWPRSSPAMPISRGVTTC